MNSSVDPIRPATQAELPALAHVTNRDEQRRKDPPKKPEKKKHRQQDQTIQESPSKESASPRDDSTGGSIDLLV